MHRANPTSVAIATHVSPKRQRVSDQIEVARRVLPSGLANERELMATKWFDYRFQTPLQSTQLFVETYQSIYRDKWGMNFDINEAPKKRGIARDGLTNGREFTSFLIARQMADAQGVPYDFYIRHAMDFHLDNGYTKLPRPNQLWSSKWPDIFVNKLASKWSELRASMVQVSRLPQYHLASFKGLEVQLSHQDWVLDQIDLHHTDPYQIGKCCYVWRVLPEERAVARFGLEKVEQSRKRVLHETEDATLIVADEALRPSCFLLPHAFDLASPTCGSCVLRDCCCEGESKLRSFMRKKYGSDNLVQKRTREQTRRRVQKYRALKKAAREGAQAPP